MSAPPVGTDLALWDKLTGRERALCLHPMAMTKPIDAAVESGYSPAWARGNAHMKVKQLRYFILPIAQKRLAAKEITLERIYEELGAIAFADETEYYERVENDAFGGEVLMGKDPTLLPEAQRRAIEHVHSETIELSDGTKLQRVSFTLHDKKPAIKMLAEMLGGFDPRTRTPGDTEERRRQSALFEFMKDDEIDTITKIYKRAEKRQREAATDAEVIEAKQ